MGSKGLLPSRYGMVALWAWYRGAGFVGYQQQAGLRTVQGELLRAFAEAGLERNPVVAGRTDKGVSARMQVLSARLDVDVPPASLVTTLNARLPDDLRVHLARPVPKGFHAAWSATSKEYRYALPLAAAGDLALLGAAAALVPGTRDFQVFHGSRSEKRPRTVRSVELWPGPDAVTLRFVGDGFARHMVRFLVGALSAVARGEVTLDVLRAGLDQQVRFGCPMAPPEPLTLWDVGYAPEVDPFTADERAGFGWPR